MEVGCCGTQTLQLELCIGCSGCPFELVPVDLKIGTNPNFMWRTRTKEIRQVEENGLLASGGKAQVGLRNPPATFAVRNFEAKTPSLPPSALRDRDIY